MDATFNQRKAIYRMRSALNISFQGIKNLSFEEASEEIDRLKKQISQNGFPQREDESYLDGRDGRFKLE